MFGPFEMAYIHIYFFEFYPFPSQMILESKLRIDENLLLSLELGLDLNKDYILYEK